MKIIHILCLIALWGTTIANAIDGSSPAIKPSRPSKGLYGNRALASAAPVEQKPVHVIEERTSGDFSQGQVSLELAGAALVYSLMGSFRPLSNLVANLGFSRWSASSTMVSGTSFTSVSLGVTQIPASVSYLLGRENSYFEILGGVDLILLSGAGSFSNLSASGSGTSLLPEFGVGYRYWPKDGGFHFRAMLYGILFPKVDTASTTSASTSVGGFLPWAGLSFGYAF